MLRPAETLNTNWRSDLLSPPHHEFPPSGAVKSWTVIQGCVDPDAVGVPVTRPLEDIERPEGNPPFVTSHL
jgi:hypothetical protein